MSKLGTNIFLITMKGLDTVESLSVEVKGSKVSLKYFTWKIKINNFYCSDFCTLLKLEVVDIKKILVPNLLIYIYLHCLRSSS